MAGDALHLYRTIESCRRDQSLVYLMRHLHHRTGCALRRLGVGGEIIVVEVGGILSDVAVIAAHAQRAGEPAHDADDFGAARIGGQHLEVGELVRNLTSLGQVRHQETGRQENGARRHGHGPSRASVNVRGVIARVKRYGVNRFRSRVQEAFDHRRP